MLTCKEVLGEQSNHLPGFWKSVLSQKWSLTALPLGARHWHRV